jgi:hypothetical protein
MSSLKMAHHLQCNHPVFAILVTERFADPIVSLPTDAFRKREAVHLRSTGKIGSPVTIRQPSGIDLRTLEEAGY